VLSLIRNALRERRRGQTKAYWRTHQWESCKYSDRIFDALEPVERASLRRILEFGCDSGGNLQYFMDRLPRVSAVGIDLRDSARALEHQYAGRYAGIVGDETSLARLADREFDLAFTVSVLDHLPDELVVDQVIDGLIRTSRRVLLLEPWIEGVHGDVSGKTRDQVKRGLERGHKRFAPTSYMWDFNAMLAKKPVDWRRAPMPLHAASQGPFFQLYDIRPRSTRTGGAASGTP
jgi:SAM-dependent methyltransferase